MFESAAKRTKPRDSKSVKRIKRNDKKHRLLAEEAADGVGEVVERLGEEVEEVVLPAREERLLDESTRDID